LALEFWQKFVDRSLISKRSIPGLFKVSADGFSTEWAKCFDKCAREWVRPLVEFKYFRAGLAF
jgi:hypothetical protein